MYDQDVVYNFYSELTGTGGVSINGAREGTCTKNSCIVPIEGTRCYLMGTRYFLHVPSRAPYQFVCDCGKGFVTLRFNDSVKMLAQRKLIIIFIRFLYKGKS